MVINKVNYNMKCNNPNCCNNVNYCVELFEGCNDQNIYLCKNCLQNLELEISKVLKPKCIENKLKKNKIVK